MVYGVASPVVGLNEDASRDDGVQNSPTRRLGGVAVAPPPRQSMRAPVISKEGRRREEPRWRWLIQARRTDLPRPAGRRHASAYAQSLARADGVSATPVAFPSIAAGVYGYPLRDRSLRMPSAIRRVQARPYAAWKLTGCLRW